VSGSAASLFHATRDGANSAEIITSIVDWSRLPHSSTIKSSIHFSSTLAPRRPYVCIPYNTGAAGAQLVLGSSGQSWNSERVAPSIGTSLWRTDGTVVLTNQRRSMWRPRRQTSYNVRCGVLRGRVVVAHGVYARDSRSRSARLRQVDEAGGFPIRRFILAVRRRAVVNRGDARWTPRLRLSFGDTSRPVPHRTLRPLELHPTYTSSTCRIRPASQRIARVDGLVQGWGPGLSYNLSPRVSYRDTANVTVLPPGRNGSHVAFS